MKYVIINGSPRRKNTWAVVQEARKSINGEFEEIHLSKEKIPMCNGCYNCIMESEKKCPHYDIISPIIEKMKNADGIILASPVYAMNVPGLLKNFIDHVAYLYHRPQLFTKKALIIVTTAGAGHKDVAKYLDETLRHWGVNKVYRYAFACGGKDYLETKDIKKVAVKFSADVESGKYHSPKFGDIIFFDVWKAMAYTKEPIKPDRDFWFETGLANHDFAPEIKLNIFKKAFSKLMFAIMKRVIK